MATTEQQRAEIAEANAQGIAYARAWKDRRKLGLPAICFPSVTAAQGPFPYCHRTVAQVDAGWLTCPACSDIRLHACTYSQCPLAPVEKRAGRG